MVLEDINKSVNNTQYDTAHHLKDYVYCAIYVPGTGYNKSFSFISNPWDVIKQVFIYSKYILSAYYMPATVLNTKDELDKASALIKMTFR